MPKTYPAVVLVSRHGRQLALAVAAVIALAALLVLFVGQHVTVGVVGLVLAAATWGLLRLLAEIVEVVAETLLPR